MEELDMHNTHRPLRRGSALTKTERQEYGPVQILVVGFESPNLHGEIVDELRRLRELEIIRLVDMIVVANQGDDLVAVQTSDLTPEEEAAFGSIVGALIGLGANDEAGAQAGATLGGEFVSAGGVLGPAIWSVADVVAPGTVAAVALIEHRWAIPLRDRVQRAGGSALGDAWVHPEDLVLYGLAQRMAADRRGAASQS